MRRQDIAWHYTIGDYFKLIIECGFIRPANANVAPPEIPAVWFSKNPYWELTANKGLNEGGLSRGLSMIETYQYGNGLVRFGINAFRLIQSDEIRRVTKMPKEVWRSLCEAGKEQGAKPSEWCCSLEAVEIESLIIEVMDEKFRWVSVTNL